MKVFIASSQEGPHGAGPLVDVTLLSFAGVVGQERAVEAGVRVLHQFDLQGQDSLHLGASAAIPSLWSQALELTRNASLNSNRQGNCLSS